LPYMSFAACSNPDQWTLSLFPCYLLPNSCLMFSRNASESCRSPYVSPLTHLYF
jgi:hypothetical protein